MAKNQCRSFYSFVFFCLRFYYLLFYHRFLHEGCFWGQTVHGNSKESPLVSMHERPLIVPATLQYSGLRHRGVALGLVSANRWLRGIKTYRFPWYLTLVSTNPASSNWVIDYRDWATSFCGCEPQEIYFLFTLVSLP